MRPALSHSASAAGFTLMELVVVIALIAIVSAMIIPEMRGTYEDALLRSSSRQFIDVFRLANARAVSLSQTCRVRLDRNAGRFVLEKQIGRPARAAAPTFAPLREVSGGEGTIDHRISFEMQPAADAAGDAGSPSAGGKFPNTKSDDAITFYPDGTADACRLILSDRAGFRLTLRINPVTSRAQLIRETRP